MTRIPKRGALLGFLVLLAGAWVLLPPPPHVVEAWYTRGVFRVVSAVLVPLTDSVPFSATVFCGVAGLVALSVLGILGWRRSRRAGSSLRQRLLGGLEIGVWLLVGGFLVFLVLWGGNYHRVSLASRLSLGSKDPSPVEIATWVEGLLTGIRHDLSAREAGDPEGALHSLRTSLEGVLERWYGWRPRLPDRVKSLPDGSLLAFGTAGFTSPLLEAHVDGALPEHCRLAVAAHELAHTGGVCSEADADLAAAAAGLEADDGYARYCVALDLFRRFSRSLPSGQAKEAWNRLPVRAREDIERAREVRRRYEVTVLSGLQTRLYDGYLKLQGSREGVREYSLLERQLVRAAMRGFVRVPGAGEGRGLKSPSVR